MMDWLSRTRVLVGDEGVARLQGAYVGVIGLGGVGGYALEALARAGIGRMFLVDADFVDITNLNRQILALDDTLNKPKVEVARERIRHINPEARIEVLQIRLTPENIESAIPSDLPFAIDAIDCVDAKISLIATFIRRGTRFVSCMGAGSKLSPTGLRIADIAATKSCPLARAVRQGLRKRGILKGVRCVYSEEILGKVCQPEEDSEGKHPQGTISYVPGLAGLMAAGIIINDILATAGGVLNSSDD